MSNKPRVVKDYDKLDLAIQEQIKMQYPYGFDKYLITFKNIKNAFVSALPFETEDKYYLVRMTREQAIAIIARDDDYNDSGRLKNSVLENLKTKHSDEDDEDLDLELDDFDENEAHLEEGM